MAPPPIFLAPAVDPPKPLDPFDGFPENTLPDGAAVGADG